MVLPPYAKILFDPDALRRLGRMPDPVKHCLKKAFASIRDRKLILDPPVGWNYPFVARACQHIIYASVDTNSNTVVVLDLLLDLLLDFDIDDEIL